jgi:hypothetical protein
VFEVTTLIVDFADVPAHEIKRCVNSAGRTYFRIDYEVQFSVQSSLEFSMSVKGKRYGSVTASYDV